MKKYLDSLPEEIRDLIHLAGKIASGMNMPIYLVGGFVRDLLLGEKNLDLDITVELDGIAFAEAFSGPLGAKLIRHKRFGTATLVSDLYLKVDIATARKEIYPEPASLPEVTPGSLRDDLFRRDFTINAMAISLNREDSGRLIDLFGGAVDLRHKRIRILHNLSFIDDPTRILRAIRFEQRYNFRIEPVSLKLLKEAAKTKMLEKTEPQRIRDELILGLKEEQPLRGVRRIQELAGLGFINKGLYASGKTYALFRSLGKQIAWFNAGVFPHKRQIEAWLVYLIGLLDSLDLKKVKDTCRKFVFRRGEEGMILAFKKLYPGLVSKLSKPAIRPSEIFHLLEPLGFEVILLLKAKAKNGRVTKHIEDFFLKYNGVRIHITGHDLKDLGVSPGPRYQKIFTRMRNAKLDGMARDKEEELALVKKWIKAK
jgi:tRNA nucleotidyltransferase (CCA-adding enzyme)